MSDYLNLEDAAANERGLIGCLLSVPHAIHEVAPWLRPEAFTTVACEQAYRAARRMWETHQEINLVTIANGYEELGFPYNSLDLMRFMNDYQIGVWASEYADRIVRFAERRALAGLSQDIIRLAHGESAEGWATTIQGKLEEIAQIAPGKHLRTIREVAEQVPLYRDEVFTVWEGGKIATEIPLGLPSLDKLLDGGVRRGELVVAAGRPGMGKTAFVGTVANKIASRKEGHVLYFSCEMGEEAVLDRSFAEFSGIPTAVVKHEDCPRHIRERVVTNLEQWTEFHLAIDCTVPTTEEVFARVQAFQQRKPVDLVIFDYLQLARNKLGRSGSEEQRVAQISGDMKRLAMECKVPVILVSQLNREVESRPKGQKRPVLSDLRYSGAIEQDADIAIFFYRHQYYVEMGMEEPIEGTEESCEVLVEKNRRGRVGVRTLRFDAPITAFREFNQPRYA